MPWQTAIWFIGVTVLPSLLTAWAAAYWVRRQAVRWRLVDRPAARKVHATETPLGGGIAIWLGVLLPLAAMQLLLWIGGPTTAWLPRFAQQHLDGIRAQSTGLWVLLAGGTLLMLLGLQDDRRGLPWKLRLTCQFAIAAACVLGQGWQLTAFIQAPALTTLLSVFWIVGLINSFNMLDNMDGLSAGVAAIAAAMLAAVLLLIPDPVSHAPQLFVGGLLLVITGACLGFLWHNRSPARMFMGDAGSYFVGFCIAVATLLATYASYHSETRHAVLAPVCVMAVPLYDMITVLWIRISEGRSPFEADKSHFSHRLVELGLSKGQAVLTIYLTTATCGLGAILLQQVHLFGAVVVLLQVLCVLSLIAILETTARRNLKNKHQRR